MGAVALVLILVFVLLLVMNVPIAVSIAMAAFVAILAEGVDPSFDLPQQLPPDRAVSGDGISVIQLIGKVAVPRFNDSLGLIYHPGNQVRSNSTVMTGYDKKVGAEGLHSL